MGKYTNQFVFMYPFPTDRYPIPFTKPVGIDVCIAETVLKMWENNIETDASCCGHGIIFPTIILKNNDWIIF